MQRLELSSLQRPVQTPRVPCGDDIDHCRSDSAEISSLKVKRDIDQADHDRRLDQWPDDRGKRSASIDAEDGNRGGGGKLSLLYG